MATVPEHAHRPSLVGRVARILLPGVRHVHAQVAPYAALWDTANAAALKAAGPLWVVLGDSTAQGIGAPSYDQGYVGQLRRRLDEERGVDGPWRVLNWSRSGARVQDVLRDQLPRLEALGVEPDLVTCAIGANDIYRTPLERILAGMREVIRRLPAGAVIATIPQGLRPQKAVAVSNVIRTEGAAAGLVVADVWARTGPPWRGKFAEDNFHPGVQGYADWTAAFADALGLPAKTGG
jgi:lysophospholipase L1-like esterase